MMPSRREVLRSVASLAAAAPLIAQPDRKQDRLDRLEIFRVRVNHRGNWQLVRLTTADGATGIGDASHGRSDAGVEALVQTYWDRLRTLSVWDVEAFRSACLADARKAGRDGAVAYSALEQCCWDVRGKLAGRPVCDLLGGRLRSRIRNYANINRADQSRKPEDFARLASAAKAAGFDAVKLAPWDGMPKNDAERARLHTDRGVACIEAVRKACGDSFEILVDGHSNFHLEGALAVMRRLESANLSWLEEMVPGIANLAAFNRQTERPTAGGESLFAVDAFYPYISAGAVDIVMPDVKYSGGVFEMKKIAAIAEAAGQRCSPHGPASPVGNAAAAHVCATLPNFHILEMAFGECDWRAGLVTPAESVEQGHIEVSSRAGFGIDLNEAALREHRAS